MKFTQITIMVLGLMFCSHQAFAVGYQQQNTYDAIKKSRKLAKAAHEGNVLPIACQKNCDDKKPCPKKECKKNCDDKKRLIYSGHRMILM